MNEPVSWELPPFLTRSLEAAPKDKPIMILLRHSIRNALPPGDAAYTLPITSEGKQLATELGTMMGARLMTLHTSPLTRCVQTAEALQEAADVAFPIVQDRLLGDPGAFVLDGARAWSNWERLGHEGVMRHLVSATDALPGMARPRDAAIRLVQHMFSTAGKVAGLHVFVTHDSLVTATAAQVLGRPLGVKDWPWFLGGAFFWRAEDMVQTTYRQWTGLTKLNL